MRHVLDEFQRVALANADIFFSLHHNGTEVFHLPSGNLRQRIVNLFGNNSNKKLVPVSEETDALKLEGFIGKPEFSKKTRGEQFFFVNNRFIRSAYLNHAIVTAYEQLLPANHYPLYIIFIEIDPARIDINVHPTKQEIKFEDERLVYNYLKVSVRHALGQYSITPTLDFDLEPGLSGINNNSVPQTPTYTSDTVGSSGNTSPRPSSKRGETFESFTSNRNNPTPLESSNLKNWKNAYDGLEDFDTDNEKVSGQPFTIESAMSEESTLDDENKTFTKETKPLYQVHSSYIVSHIKSGYILVDQQAAHERILYERYLKTLGQEKKSTQKELFPKTITFNPSDALILKDIAPQINLLGFDLQEFGKDTFVVQGVPTDMKPEQNVEKMIEDLLEQYKANIEIGLHVEENIANSMAKSSAIKRGQNLVQEEMQELIDQLFACEIPFKSPSGRKCFITFELDELSKKFAAD